MSESLESLMKIPKHGAGIGLHRVLALSDEIRRGDWMAGLDAIKVTGSNGKGSVCAMISSILGALGVGHGLYVSPHLVRFHERMAVNGKLISDDELDAAIDWFLPRCAAYEQDHPGDRVGAFEAFTVVALRHFAAASPETLVLEAGIGGRYDPVRVVLGTWAALTSLDLEHSEILGSTLDQIAYDKADLCPDGGTLVLGDIDEEILRRVEAYCRLRAIRTLRATEEARPLAVRYSGGRMEVDFELAAGRLNGVEVGLPGPHQVSNAAVALVLTRAWLERHRPGLPPAELEEGVRRGLAAVEWPGRFQQVGRAPDVFIDVGHTPAAVDALVRTVQTVLAGRQLVLVTGVSYDKQVDSIVSSLVPLAERVVCTRAHHKGSPVARIEEIVRRVRPDVPVESVEQIEDAMARATAIAREQGMTVLVAGGLFLGTEAAQALRGEDPRQLRFF